MQGNSEATTERSQNPGDASGAPGTEANSTMLDGLRQMPAFTTRIQIRDAELAELRVSCTSRTSG
jgi:hypothetical protein